MKLVTAGFYNDSEKPEKSLRCETSFIHRQNTESFFRTKRILLEQATALWEGFDVC
jgi:hypothetical protein